MMRRKAPENVRVSLGSAVVLGLTQGFLDAKPTTVYLLTYRRGKCYANCKFCPQARGSKGRADMLSRVVWPLFRLREVLPRVEDAFKRGLIRRVCIQALNYPGVLDDILAIAREIRAKVEVPISVSCQPLGREEMRRLAEAGVERVSIALDAATKDIFDRVKGSLAGGPYRWKKHIKALGEAVKIFGRGFVTTHLIVGLGETEMNMIKIIQWCVDSGICPALFAFTPIPGTALEKRSQPPLNLYRRIQLARYLIVHRETRFKRMRFSEEGVIVDFGLNRKRLLEVVRSGEPFLTSGCPNCNRPYYNERPSGPIYNYPRPLLPEEIDEVERCIMESLDEQ